MSNSVNNTNHQVSDQDFNIEEIEQVVAPDVNDVPGSIKATSIVTICQCN
jgi:hypothetical protein